LNQNFVKPENDDMSHTRRHLHKLESKKQIARAMKQRLIMLVSFLTTILIALIFRIGESWWTEWMIDHQKQMIGIMLLAIICVIALSPLIIEADSHPRALSGPGKTQEAQD
jgi:Na+/melibiose symporter-like transporter